MNEAQLQNARRLQQAGQHADAARLYAEILRVEPRNFDALFQLGNIYLANRRLIDAERLYAAAVQVNSQSAELFYNRGCALQSLGRNQDALAAFAHALAIRPDHAEARNNRGVTLLALKRYQEALACFDRVLAERPGVAIVQNNRSTALFALKRPDEALAAADAALAENPRLAEALYSRGAALLALGRHEEALSSFDKALFVNRDYVEALTHRGVVLALRDRHEEALASYNRALAIQPGNIDVLYDRATSFWTLKRFEEAIPDCEQVLKIDPHFKYARGNLLQNKMQCCDWQSIPEEKAKIAADMRDDMVTLNPLVAIMMFDSPDALLKTAQFWTASECPPSPPAVWKGERYHHDRIRVAYVSADFRMHAVAQLMAGIFERHDRARFETIAICLAPDDRSPIRRRLEQGFERFIDVREQSDADVAKLLRGMEIDIAVDVMGHTQGARTSIFARRPVPIQVNYLGFPGTMGAPYMDYILADRTVVPEERWPGFAETVAYLPHCYLPNDCLRAIAAPPSRAEAGLPDTGFVFCTFNNLYKVTPAMFDIWMRLLGDVPGSVLWLSQPNPPAVRNLRREAEARGIAGARILFAPFVQAPEEHLARLGLADLFLDTLPYNAHATACDALWAGVPLVTLEGASFAGRVGASLLSAVGLPELIAHSPAEYEACALRLAREPAALAGVREKLARNRKTHPLFDTARFTRNLETAYVTMWERHRRGERPASFAVADSAPP